MIDLVFPNGNEKEFLEIAKKLNIKLCFIYPYTKKLSFPKLPAGLIAHKKEIDKAVKVADLVLTYERDRHVFEKTKVDLVFDLEQGSRADHTHQRNSGLNHILCNIAKERNILIGFNFNSVLKAKNKKKIIGRMMQNVKLCRKYKVKTVIASFAKNPFEMRSFYDLISFGVTIGMHPKQAKDSLNNAEQRILLNKKKKSKGYIAEGIEKL